MDSAKTDEELTSTMGNVLSTSKEEKNDSSDATPTSSTDANTNPKASQTVSDDPISSTSSDTFEQSKLPDMKLTIDEPDRLQSEEHVNDLLEMPVSNEKITEDVEDLVHDLESLLGEATEPYSLPSKQKAEGKGEASGKQTIVEKTKVNEDKVELSKKEAGGTKSDTPLPQTVYIKENDSDKLHLETASGLPKIETSSVKESSSAPGPSYVPEPSSIPEPSSVSEPSSITEPSSVAGPSSAVEPQDISKNTEEDSVNVDNHITSKVVEESELSTVVNQSASEQIIENHSKDSGDKETPQLVSQESDSVQPPVGDDDADSVGSWEIIDASEADCITAIPGPSGQSSVASISKNTAEDITSSGDKTSSIKINEEIEETREAESIQVEQNNSSEVTEITDQSSETTKEQQSSENNIESELFSEIREAESMITGELNKEADTSQADETEVENVTSQIVEESPSIASPIEITSSEVCAKLETQEASTITENSSIEQDTESKEEKEVENLENESTEQIKNETEDQVPVSSEVEEIKAVEERKTVEDNTGLKDNPTENLENVSDVVETKKTETEEQEEVDLTDVSKCSVSNENLAKTDPKLEHCDNLEETIKDEKVEGTKTDVQVVVEDTESENPKSEEIDPQTNPETSEKILEKSEVAAPQEETCDNLLESSEVISSEPAKNETSETVTNKDLAEDLILVESTSFKNSHQVEPKLDKSETQETVIEDVSEVVESEDLQQKIITEDLKDEKSGEPMTDENNLRKAKFEEENDNKLAENVKESASEDVDMSKISDDEKNIPESVLKEVKEPIVDKQEMSKHSTLEFIELSEKPKDSHKGNATEAEVVLEKVDVKPVTERKPSRLAELEFAPLQLSEDDSDDSETVPRLALEPDDSNSSVIAELPSVEIPPVEEIEDKPLYVQSVVPSVIDASDNLETMLAVASLQSIDIPKHTETDHIVSEKERREMEALAIAVQSITDNSNSYMEEYMETNVVEDNLETEVAMQEVMREEPAIESSIQELGNESQSKEPEEKEEEHVVVQEPEALDDPRAKPSTLKERESEKASQNSITQEIKELDVEPPLKSVSERESRLQESVTQEEQGKKDAEIQKKEISAEAHEDKLVEQEKATTLESTSENKSLEEENEKSLKAKIIDLNEEKPSVSIEESTSGIVEEKNTEVEEKTSEVLEEKNCEISEEKLKENPSHSSENSQDSTNSTNEVSIKEGKKLRSNDKSKKHKKAEKYEELTINVDISDKEISYSPKITIKPIKVPDDEVSTTTCTDSEVFKGSLKMTITKQSDKMHSILKISDQDNSEALPEQDEPIPKLIIKPKVQQIEQQHSPKMSTRSSKQSPTASNQRSGSPRITIKPVVKPDKQEPVSPLKIKINTKVNTKTGAKEDDIARKVLIKPLKPAEEVEQGASPRITIKPIPKPDSEKDVNPRLTIKPLKKPEEDTENEDKERSSPKIIIKPVVKPQESDTSLIEEEQEEVKERIVLKINKGNLPSPAKESKKREHPPDDDKSEKLAKITVKFSKEGGHPHIVHQQGDESLSKRSYEDTPSSNLEKNKKQKVEMEPIISTRSSARHKEQLEVSVNDKSNPGCEPKLKHKDQSHESPIEVKRARKDNLNDKSKLLKDENSDELLLIETKVYSPIVISEDSRSQDSSSIILLDESRDDSVSSDRVKTPDSIRATSKTVILEGESATPSPVPKRGRGRPRKVPLEVREEVKFSEETQKPKDFLKSKELEVSSLSQVHESGRPKRSCRGQSVCDTLGIKPRKPRGPGRGRGGKRGMGNRAVTEREPCANNPIDDELKLEKESDKSTEKPENKDVNRSKNEVIVIEDEDKPEVNTKSAKKTNTKRKSIEKEKKIEIPVIEIDSGDSQLSEKETETDDRNVDKNPEKKSDDTVEPMEVDDNDAEVEIIIKHPEISDKLATPSTSNVQELISVDDKRSILKDLVILAEKPLGLEEKIEKEIESKKGIIDDATVVPFASLAPPSTPKNFSSLGPSITCNQIIESSSTCKSSNPDISSVSSTTVPAEVMIVDEETRMSTETNSRAQTPAKQVITSSDMVEESQSSVHSTATTESGKTPSRANKAPRLEVQETESQIITADLLTEYYWNGNGPFMLQEQVAQFLGIKSFKRKYPGIMRRMLDMQERDFIREKGLASEHMCDLGLTAVNSADILDIMYSDFQEKYEEYCKHQRDRQAKELINKQRALSLATSQEKSKADITEQAVHSAAHWNARFNKERKEQRKACMDLQNFNVHYPKGKKAAPATNPHPGNYPVALVPGQFSEYYKEFTPTELNNLPINTLGYDEVHFIPRENSDEESGSESDSDSSSSSGSSSCSSSNSDSSSGIEDCKLCKHSPKKSMPMSPPAATPAVATAK